MSALYVMRKAMADLAGTSPPYYINWEVRRLPSFHTRYYRYHIVGFPIPPHQLVRIEFIFVFVFIFMTDRCGLWWWRVAMTCQFGISAIRWTRRSGSDWIWRAKSLVTTSPPRHWSNVSVIVLIHVRVTTPPTSDLGNSISPSSREIWNWVRGDNLGLKVAAVNSRSKVDLSDVSDIDVRTLPHLSAENR